MRIITERYSDAVARLPASGRHIVAHEQADLVVLYAACKPATADYAVSHQVLAGPVFSRRRMSWFKPNFLWMMHRSGWATREGQERVLALWLSRSDLMVLLAGSVASVFDPRTFGSHEEWKRAARASEVRVQWDPDRDPAGLPTGRRAIQVGVSGAALARFGGRQIRLVEDVTSFVREQKAALEERGVAGLLVPRERVVAVPDAVAGRIGLWP